MPDSINDLDEISIQIEGHLASFVSHLAEKCLPAEPVKFRGFCGYQTETPHFLGCGIAPLPDASVQDVDEVVEYLKQRAKPAFWAAGERSARIGIVDALQTAGFAVASGSPGMVLDLADFRSPALPEGCEIRRVETKADAIICGEVASRAFELPEAIGNMLSFLDDPDRSATYLIFCDRKPVGMSFGLRANSILGIYNVGVVAEFRGRGLGAAISAAPIVDFQSRGISRVVLHASAMGHRVYKSLGFRDHGLYRFAGFIPRNAETLR